MSYLDRVYGADRSESPSTPAPSTGLFDDLFSLPTGFTLPDTATAPEAAGAPLQQLTHRPQISHDLRITDRFCGPDDLPAILPLLSAAVEISLDLETTHKTPWAPPLAPGKGALVGGGLAWPKYLAKHQCAADVRPRARIISLETDNGLICAVDLDLLDGDQAAALIAAMCRPDAVWVGHNLSFDLQWINHLSPGARPGRIVDTMLLVTACRADLEFEMIDRVHKAGPNPAGLNKSILNALLKRHKGPAARDDGETGGLSLNLLSTHLLGESLDKSYQKPHNWMPAHLSDGHLEYCLGDTRAPRIIARRMMGLAGDLRRPIADVLAAIDRHPGGPAYRTFEHAIPRLVQMQHRGIRIDRHAAAKYVAELDRKILTAVDHLIALAPGLELFRDRLADPGQGLKSDLKAALSTAFQQRTGRALPLAKDGGFQTSGKMLTAEFPGEPLVAAWTAQQEAGKRMKMLADYLARADHESRLHALTSIATVTGRTSSQEPNLQNMPRDDTFRACFVAAPGNRIIATDFSAVEMRIAACLAERAYAEFVRGGLAIPEWITKAAPEPFSRVLECIRAGTPAAPLVPASWPLPAPPIDGGSFEAWGAHYASRYAVVLARLQAAAGCGFRRDSIMADIEHMALPAAFRSGIDPHLVTAIQTEARAGRVDLGRHATAPEYLTSRSGDEREALKKEMKKPRTAAKASNFGLLYGMSAGGLHTNGVVAYGLDWSVAEAEQARAAWFELYPEVELWHLQSKCVSRDKHAVIKHDAIIGPHEAGKLYRGSTLSGRPVYGPEMRDACNYSDQGTGAEIALAAINALPEWLLCCLVNFVHDELVFEVPADRAGEAKIEIERTMNQAADTMMGRFGVPSEVESAVADCWVH